MGIGDAQLDSLLGATLQRTKYSNTSKRILTDASAIPQDTSDIKVVSGLDVFSNNNVRTTTIDTPCSLDSLLAARSILYLQH
jgi:Integral membrane protein DUF92